MGSDIAKSAASAYCFLEPPGERGFRIRGPILQISAAKIKDFPDGAFVDIFFGKLYGRRFAVIKRNHGFYIILLCGKVHSPCLLGSQCQRLFADNVFSGFCGSDGDIGVSVVWRTDIHNGNGRIVDDIMPVCGI